MQAITLDFYQSLPQASGRRSGQPAGLVERSCCSSSPKTAQAKNTRNMSHRGKKSTNTKGYTKHLTLEDTDTRGTRYIKLTDKTRSHTPKRHTQKTHTKKTHTFRPKTHSDQQNTQTNKAAAKNVRHKNKQNFLKLKSFLTGHSSHTANTYFNLFPLSGRAVLVCSQQGASLKRANNFFVKLFDTEKTFTLTHLLKSEPITHQQDHSFRSGHNRGSLTPTLHLQLVTLVRSQLATTHSLYAFSFRISRPG